MKTVPSFFRLHTLFFTLLLLCIAEAASAQLSGSVGFGVEATNNVQTLDTIAPDQLLMPAFELNYDWRVSGVSKISFTGAYTPSFYQVNPGLSFNQTTLGATGLFYLTNQDAIAAESNSKESDDEINPRRGSHFMRSQYETMNPTMNSLWNGFPQPVEIPLKSYAKITDVSSANDSLVDLAVSAL